MNDPASTKTRRTFAARFAAVSWIALIALCVAWESVLAPLRPGGSWLVLKAVPLLVAAPGVVRAHPKALQWALLLVTLYVAEGVVRLGETWPHSALAAAELALGGAFYAAAIAHLRPLKRAARQAQRRDE